MVVGHIFHCWPMKMLVISAALWITGESVLLMRGLRSCMEITLVEVSKGIAE